MRSTPDLIIIDAGLAGLACARELLQQGYQPLVLEALRAAGLSDRMINGFLRPFLTGVLYRRAPSIQWALASGRRTGEAVAAALRA